MGQLISTVTELETRLVIIANKCDSCDIAVRNNTVSKMVRNTKWQHKSHKINTGPLGHLVQPSSQCRNKNQSSYNRCLNGKPPLLWVSENLDIRKGFFINIQSELAFL